MGIQVISLLAIFVLISPLTAISRTTKDPQILINLDEIIDKEKVLFFCSFFCNYDVNLILF